MTNTYQLRTIKKRRLRRKLKSRLTSSERLRLSVFRSNRHIWAQIIDDSQGSTLVATSSKELLKNNPQLAQLTKTDLAAKVGTVLAKKALALNINKVYLDRGYYKYHGRLKALAEAARQQGLEF